MTKKNLFRSVVFLLTVVLLIRSFHFSTASATADSVKVPSSSWIAVGNYNTDWYTEATTEYEIKTAAELAGLAYLSQNGNSFTGKKIFITADIDLGAHNWSGIGVIADLAFEGTIIGKKDQIEGKAVTVRNLICANANQTRMGFIRRQSAGGVQNLIFEDAYVLGAGYHSVICGDVRLKTAGATYQNLTVKNSCVEGASNQTSVLGLMFGCVNLWDRTVTMFDLKVIGSYVKNAGSEVGGLIGRATWGTLNLQNTATVDCNVAAVSMVGGMIGWSDMRAITFERCFVSGEITADRTATGGFLAYVSPADVQLSFSNCQSDAVVCVTNTGSGGAFVGVALDSYLSKVTFANCLSTGISRSGDVYAWFGYNGVGELAVANCYSNSQLPIAGTIVPTYLDFAILDEKSVKEQVVGFDFENIWLFRSEKTPILAFVSELVQDPYVSADLGWFDPLEKTEAFHIDTERQLLGLGKLSHLITPEDYEFNVATALIGQMTDEIFDEAFLQDFDPNHVRPILKGFQTRDNEDGSYDIRFVALMDDYEKYVGAGFDFVLNGKNDQSAQRGCRYVYESLLVENDTIYATDFGGGQFFCYEIRGLKEQVSYTFDVTCYTQTTEETVEGTTWTIVLNGDGTFEAYIKGYEEKYGVDRYSQIVIPTNSSKIEELIAYELKSIISDRWGCDISVVTDSVQKLKNEIVIGNTNRFSAITLDGQNYSVSVKEGSVLISAGSAYGLRAALDRLSTVLSEQGGMLSDSLISLTGNATENATDDTSAYYISNRAGNIRVMMFNIYAWDGYGGVSLRAEMQKEMIGAYLPDVIGFQEYGDFENHGYKTLMSAWMKTLGYVEVNTGHKDGSNCTPLFYNPKTVRLKSESSYGYFLYSGANDLNSKSLTWAVFEENQTDGKAFAVISTHFMWDQGGIDHTETRVSNATELLTVIKNVQNQYGTTLPIIVGGDLNCIGVSDPITVLKNGGLKWFYDLADTSLEYGIGGYPTYNSNKKFYTKYQAGTRYTDSNIDNDTAIDFLFGTGNMTVKNYVTVTDYLARCTSDHSAKMADIILN